MITYRYIKVNEPFQSADSVLMAYIPAGMSLKLQISIDGQYYADIPDDLVVIGDLTSGEEQVLKINNLMCNTYLKFVGTGNGKIKLKV